MSCGARLRPEVTDDSRLAWARERFLTAEPIEPDQVSETILASWRRSRERRVAADRIDLLQLTSAHIEGGYLKSLRRLPA